MQHLRDQGKFSILALSRSPLPEDLRSESVEELFISSFAGSELKEALKGQEFDAVVHCAAISNANECEKSPDLAQMMNTEVSAQLAQISSERSIPFCHISTDLVFDGLEAPEGGFREDESPKPLSVYAKTKFEGEERVLATTPSALILRTSLLYGPPVGEKKGFLGWITDGLKAGEQISLFQDEWRTPIYVRDVCRVIVRGLENGNHGIYHCAGRERITRYEFGVLYANHFGLDSSLILKANRSDMPSVPPRPKDVSLCVDRLVEDFDIDLSSLSSAFADFALL
jgi:dTDP-4-dehydrorhamnose reductase